MTIKIIGRRRLFYWKFSQFAEGCRIKYFKIIHFFKFHTRDQFLVNQYTKLKGIQLSWLFGFGMFCGECLWSKASKMLRKQSNNEWFQASIWKVTVKEIISLTLIRTQVMWFSNTDSSKPSERKKINKSGWN